jgi:hypothetical protein
MMFLAFGYGARFGQFGNILPTKRLCVSLGPIFFKNPTTQTNVVFYYMGWLSH